MKIAIQIIDKMVLKNDAFSVIMNFLFPLIFIVVGSVFIFGSIQLHDSGYLPIATVLIVFGSLYLLFSVHQRIFSIDKQLGEIVDIKKRFIMSRSRVYNISDVESVELRKKWRAGRSRNQQEFSVASSGQALNLSVLVVFKDKSDLLVDIYLEGSSSITINNLGVPSGGKETQEAMDLATNIAQFLNVPFEEIQQ